MVELSKLHDPNNGEMRVAAFMSGTGSNLRRILEEEKRLAKFWGRSPYKVEVIFSDRIDSKAEEIALEYRLPAVIRDIRGFYEFKGLPRTDLDARAEYDQHTVEIAEGLGITVAAYVGYMSRITAPLVDSLTGINVHPADLRVEEDGERKYTGLKVVGRAIRTGETELRSTTHLMDEGVDTGPILMVSDPVDVCLPDGFDSNDRKQLGPVARMYAQRLKEKGDWKIMPRTLLYVAVGRYAQDDSGHLYFDKKPIPRGVLWRDVE